MQIFTHGVRHLSDPRQVMIGDRVSARRQRWKVVDARSFEACRLLTLVGTDATNTGIERRLITPFDVVEPLEQQSRLRVVRLPGWRRAVGSLAAIAGSPETLRTAARARIDLLPHQLEPALAIVRGIASRLLIADEVGLGKTIEAG